MEIRRLTDYLIRFILLFQLINYFLEMMNIVDICRYKILWTVLISILTIHSVRGQELMEKKNGKLKQQTFVYAGFGVAKPDSKYPYDADIHSGVPFPVIGLTGLIGGTYFITKHYGLSAELSGNYFFESLSSGDGFITDVNLTTEKSRWLNAHLLISPMYSSVFHRFAVDYKLMTGLTLLHVPAFTVNYQHSSTITQNESTTLGWSLGIGVRARYRISNRLGCFFNNEYLNDITKWKSYHYRTSFNCFNSQLGIVLYLGGGK
ncbi:MAG: hypothetical protein JWO58_2908 [Chitinophagaceae bacterium]|nr:hypothetical protein [Chitinophagaceae bacterium]